MKLINFTEFFGYFPFSESKILILMENIQNKNFMSFFAWTFLNLKMEVTSFMDCPIL